MAYNLLDWQILIFSALNKRIESIDIGFLMLAPMIFNGCLADDRSQGIGQIRKFGLYEFHSLAVCLIN